MKTIDAERRFTKESEYGKVIFYDTMFFKQLENGKFVKYCDLSGHCMADEPCEDYACDNSIGIKNEEYTEEELIGKLKHYGFNIEIFD